MDNNLDFEQYAESLNNIPVSSNGVYDFPNQEVIVPTDGSITMQNVNYPILGVSMDTGEQQMMMPNEDYFFENTSNVLEIPQFQKGGKFSEKPTEEATIKEFYNQMINAPWYKERLKKNGYEKEFGKTAEEIQRLRSRQVQNAKIEYVQSNDGILNQLYKALMNRPYTPAGAGSYYDPRTNGITYVKKQADRFQVLPRSIIAHEFGHAETSKYGLSKKERDLLTTMNPDRDPSKFDWHDKLPTEGKSDINSIRYNLFRNKLFDPKTGKYKTKSGEFDDDMISRMIDDNVFWRGIKNYGADHLKKLMNTVAQNQQSQQFPDISDDFINQTLNVTNSLNA